VKCRYVDYDKDRAVREIKLLMEGKAADILNSCITCNTCFDNCPTGADPANLIFKMQEKIGTSPLIINAKPMITDRAKRFEEGQADSQVIEGDPDKPALSFDGFEFKQFPEGTLESGLFKGLTVVRGGEYMSLVGMVHMGGESFAGRFSRQVIEKFADLGKEIVYLHNEGYVLAHVKAKELGIPVPFKYYHLFEYLRDYLKKNQKDISLLNKKVAYQPNCAVRWIREQDIWLDEVFDLIGAEHVSRQYDGLNALCCSGPAIGVNKDLAVDMQTKNVQDALDAGAEALVTICPICDAVMRRATSKAGLPKIFITDLCRMGLGEIPWPA
jgi:Fe-S oxidoreductase